MRQVFFAFFVSSNAVLYEYNCRPCVTLSPEEIRIHVFCDRSTLCACSLSILELLKAHYLKTGHHVQIIIVSLWKRGYFARELKFFMVVNVL